ncbi:MAG: hypothetical protein ACRCXY_11395 [Fusobacteriaceae bacterium]
MENYDDIMVIEKDYANTLKENTFQIRQIFVELIAVIANIQRLTLNRLEVTGTSAFFGNVEGNTVNKIRGFADAVDDIDIPNFKQVKDLIAAIPGSDLLSKINT